MLLNGWSLDPLVLLSLAAGGWLYTRGVCRLWRRAGLGHGVRLWQAAAYALGLLALVVALVSPLDALSAAQFSAHMLQHLLLILVAAPLLALGAPLVPLAWALPPGASQRLALPVRQLRALGQPLPAFALHSAAIWLWHLPGPYQAALDSGWLHLAEHASLLGTAVLFWWALLRPRVSRPAYGLGVLYVFLVSLQSTALGALLTLASAPWYRAYGQLADQQLAGLLMWVPAGMLYLLIALAMFGAWLRALDSGH